MTTEGTEALYNADQLKSLLLAINPEMEKPELGMPFADYRRLYLEGRMRRARLGRVDGPMVRHRWTNLRRVKVALWVAVSQAAAWRAFVGQPLRVGRPLPSPAGHSCTVLRGLRGWLRLRKGRKARKEAIPVIIHESQAQREERNRNRNFWTKAVHWVPRLFPFSQENGDTEPLVTVDLKDLSSDEVNFILQEEAEDGLDSNLTAAEPRREGFMRESQFWRWTGALGWSLNFILLCWALFLRKAGLIDEGQDRFFGGDEAVDLQSLKYDTSTYADLVASQLQEERYVSESNRDISTVLEGQKTGRGLGSSLEALRQRAEEILRPTEEKLPNYDEVVISQKISEMQADLEEIRFDRRSPAQSVLQKLSQKPGMLRDLAEKISPILPERPNQGLLPEEFPRFLEQSAVPVMAFLTASFLVAVLSQQFLTVVTPIWRRNEEERKAMRVRKIQKDRFQEFTTSLQDSLEDLAQGRLAKAAKGFDALAAYADRWASEPTWEELLKAEIGAFWEQWGPQAFRLEANIEDWTGVPRSGASEQAAWVADRWFSSAKAVIRDFAMDAVKSWGEEASKAAAAARAAQRREATAAAEAARGARGESGLVIRIFGRWKAPEDWVNIANLPLAGDWREQALRLLLPSAKDVQDDRESRGTDVPLLGPLSEQALTAVVSGQVARAVKNSTWGALTTLGAAEGAGAEGDRTDLWRGSSISSQKPFEIGYEVVEVVTKNKEEMCALARNMPKSGTPGRVFRVNPDLQSLIESLEAAEPTEPTAVRRFPAGSRVTIKGLTGAAELNGQKGEVVPPTPQEAELAAEPRCHTRASCFTMAAALADLGRVALDVLLAVGPWVSSEHVAKSQHVVQMRHSRLESFQEGVRDMLDEHLDSSQNLTLKSTLLFGFCTAILVEGFPPQKMESEMCVDVFLFLVPWGICWLFQSMTFAVLYQRGMMTVGLDLGAVRGFNGSTIGVGGSQGRHEAPLCSALVATASLAVAATNRVAARGARGAARGSARCALRASPMQKTLNSLGAGMSEERRLAQGMREEMVQATIEASTPVPISFEQAVTWACSAALRANEEGQNRQSMYFNTGAEDSQVTGAEDTKAPSELGGVLQFAEQVAKTFALSNKLPEGTGVRVLFTDFGAKSLVATRWNPLPENLTLGRRILDHLPPVLPKRELRMEERTKLSEMCESSVMLVVAPNQSEMAAVLGIFDVMKDLGKSLGQRGPEVAVVVRVWPRPFSVWEDNPEDPEAIDGYFLLDVNDTRAQDSWMMVVQVSEKEGHHHLRDLQRIATKQAEEEILQGSQTFVDVLENRLSRSQLRRQDGRGGTTDALCAADSRRLSELLLQSLQFRRRTGGGRRSATARTTSPERAAAAEVESEVATLPSGLVHVKEWAKMEEVTALENYVDQAQRTVEAGGLFTLAALGSLARSTRRISAQPREEHQMALAARCGIFLPPLMVGAFVSSIRPFPDKLRYRESALDPEEKLLREGQNNRKIDHWPLFFYPTGVTGVQEDSLLLTTDFAPKCPNFLLSGAVAPPPRRAVSADEERFPQRVRGFTRLDSNAVVKFPCGFAVAVHHGRGTLAALWPLGRPKRLPAKMEHQGKLVPVQAPPELGEEFFQRPNFSVADGVHVRYGLEGDLRWIVNVRQGALNGLCLRFEPEGFEIVLPMKKALQLALSPCEQRLCYEHHVDVDAVRPKELNQYPPGQGAETLEEVDVAAGGRSPREWWRPQVKIVDPSKVYEAGPLALGLGDF
eukprot:g23322.t1